MELIITRHGETEENKQGIIQGHLPGKLSEKGIEQAKKLAERLKDKEIDFIFSSDLARAFETAKETARFHPEVPFETKKDLREVYWGELQGKESSRLKELENHKEKIKDIETIEETHKRVKKVVNYLLKNYYGKRVLIITHGAFQSILINHLLGEEITKKQKTGNTAITIFKFSENKKPELVLLNCDKHLE